MSTNREDEHRDYLARWEAASILSDENDPDEYGSTRPCGMLGCVGVGIVAVLLAVAIPLVVTVTR